MHKALILKEKMSFVTVLQVVGQISEKNMFF